VPSFVPRPLLALITIVLLLELLTILPTPAAAALVGAGLWMAAPGVLLTRRFFGAYDQSGIGALLIGPALGFGFSVFGVFLVWAAGIQNWLALLLGPALTWSIALLVGRSGGPRLRLPSFDRRDLVAATLLLFLVPLVTWAPYDHVREPVADGEAYRAYFTADFIWAMTVTAELAKGDVPPGNPFLRERPLNYYWMAHFLSGALYRNVAAWDVPAEAVILVTGLLFGLAFVVFMYALVRMAGAGPVAGVLAVACGFVANSYEGADMIRAIVQHGAPWSELITVNIDAVTRWFYKGMAVDGLQRLLLYQPHHLTGYALALSALWLVGFAEDVTESAVALGAGILLALALLFSTFGALIVGVAVSLLYAVRLVQQRALATAWQCAVLGAVPVGVGVAITSTLGYTDARHGSLLQFGLNPVAATNMTRVWIMSFGPLLFGGIAALSRWRWALHDGAAPTALVIAATAFYFLTNVPDSGNVWVGWRSGHMLLFAFSAMAAAWLSWAWRHRRLRPVTAIVVIALVVPAIPTVAIDVFNAQDITNREEGPGFPWTLVITPGERQALDWVRTSTPLDAVVQTDPTARGATHWSYIGAFAERRMIAGLPLAMTPLRPYEEASAVLYSGVFTAASADDAHVMAGVLGIDYLFIGRVERRAYPQAVAAMSRTPDLFPMVFKNEAVTIFRVAPVDASVPANR